MTRTLVKGPMPAIRKTRPSPLTRLVKARRSSLDVLFERSYAMKMGEVRGLRRSFYFLTQPDLAQKILLGDPELYPKSDLMSTFLNQILGNGVFVSNGPVWKRQRAMMDPAFAHARIAAVFPQMVHSARDMAGRLGAVADGRPVVIDLEMTHVTADIIFRTIFSESLPRDEAETVFAAFNHYQELAYAHGVWTMAGLPPSLSLTRLRARRHAGAIRDPLRRMVRKRLAAIELGQTPPADILSSLVAARDGEGKGFTETELVDQIAVMFLAGHETSASALSWALHLLARDQDALIRMQQEADAVFGEDGTLDFSALRGLKFTRDVFREALRLYPPVAFVPRDITVPQTMRDKKLKKGSAVFVSLWLLHRHRAIWRMPDHFDPDRFAREEERVAIREAYMPFSKGPRVCLGASFAMQEAVIILATIARHFDLAIAHDHEPRPIARLTLRSENGIRLALTPRHVSQRTSLS